MFVCLSLLVMASCGKKEEPAATAPANAPSAQNTPTYDTRLRPSDLNLVESVQFPVERIPASEDAARAVAALANAIAQGDADALRGMLGRSDAGVLDFLVSSGDWAESTSNTTVVRVCALEATDNSVRVGLGLEDDTGAYLLGWEGQQSRGVWQFSALPVNSPPAAQASDLDGAALQ